MDFRETRTKEVKTIEASTPNYNLNATVNIEGGKIINMSGTVVELNGDIYAPEAIRFDVVSYGDGLKINYHNIPTDKRVTIDLISELVDSAKARYEEA